MILWCCRRFPERHTAAHILAAYEEVVEEMGLDGKVSVVITDSAANMLAALKFDVPGPADTAGSDTDTDEVGFSPLWLAGCYWSSGTEGGRVQVVDISFCAVHFARLHTANGNHSSVIVFVLHPSPVLPISHLPVKGGGILTAVSNRKVLELSEKKKQV